MFRSDDQRRAAFAHMQGSLKRGTVARTRSFWAVKNPLQGGSSSGKKRTGGGPKGIPTSVEQGRIWAVYRRAQKSGSDLMKAAGFSTGYRGTERLASARRSDKQHTQAAWKHLGLVGGAATLAAVPLGLLALRSGAVNRAALAAVRRTRLTKAPTGLTRLARQMTTDSLATAAGLRINATAKAAGRMVDRAFTKVIGSESVGSQVMRQLNTPAPLMAGGGLAKRGVIRGLDEIVGQRAMTLARAQRLGGTDAGLARQRNLLMSVETTPYGLIDRLDLRTRNYLIGKLTSPTSGLRVHTSDTGLATLAKPVGWVAQRRTLLQRLNIPVSPEMGIEKRALLRVREQQAQWLSLRQGKTVVTPGGTLTPLGEDVIRRRPMLVTGQRRGIVPGVPQEVTVKPKGVIVPPVPKFQKVSGLPKAKPGEDVRQRALTKETAPPPQWKPLPETKPGNLAGRPYVERLETLVKQYPGVSMKDLERMAHEQGRMR